MTRTLRSRLQTALVGASLLTLGGCASGPEREARGMRLDTGAPQVLVNFSAALNDKLRFSNSPVMVTGSVTQKAPDDVQAAMDVAVAAAFAKYPIPAPPKAK